MEKIDGYDGVYLISNTGCVKSVSRKIYNYTSKEKILKPSKSRNDVVVALCKNGKTKMFAVGRLVATYFIPNPNKYPMVRHMFSFKPYFLKSERKPRERLIR